MRETDTIIQDNQPELGIDFSAAWMLLVGAALSAHNTQGAISQLEAEKASLTSQFSAAAVRETKRNGLPAAANQPSNVVNFFARGLQGPSLAALKVQAAQTGGKIVALRQAADMSIAISA